MLGSILTSVLLNIIYVNKYNNIYYDITILYVFKGHLAVAAS